PSSCAERASNPAVDREPRIAARQRVERFYLDNGQREKLDALMLSINATNEARAGTRLVGGVDGQHQRIELFPLAVVQVEALDPLPGGDAGFAVHGGVAGPFGAAAG